MSERRSLVEGLKQTPLPIDPQREKEFVFQSKHTGERQIDGKPTGAASAPVPVSARAPISTRIRADYATALKRASLERQLSNTEPNTLQDILEEAIGPWLKTNGYLP